MTVDEESKLYADTLRWMAQAGCVDWPPCAPQHWKRLNESSGPLDRNLLNDVDFVMLNGVKWHELKGTHDEWKRCYRRSLFAEIAEIVALLAVLGWVWTVHSALAIALSLFGLLWMQAYHKVYGFRDRTGRAKRITKALEELLKTQRPDLAKQERW